MNHPAALRMWLEAPNLMTSYERRGIVILTVGLRQEAASAAAMKLAELIEDYRAVGAGDPEQLDTLEEIVTMINEVLMTDSKQLLPLDLDIASPFDAIFGAVS